MPRLHESKRYKLTYDERGSKPRWRKRYQGKDYYFAVRPKESKEASYHRCWKEWQAKKLELDQQAKTEDPNRLAWKAMRERVALIMAELATSDSPSSRRHWVSWKAQFDTYTALMNVDPVPWCPWTDEVLAAERVEERPLMLGGADLIPDYNGFEPDELPPWETSEAIETDDADSIRACVATFLERKRKEAERKEVTNGRYESIRVCLEHFVTWIGGSNPVAGIDSGTLDRYRDHLYDLIDRKRLSHHSARDRLATLKQFVKWAYERELLNLPRNISSRTLKIALPSTKIEVIPDVDVKRLLAESSERTKLYLLLMLNTGMQQQDIAELRQDEVDWKEGRIIRKRGKTKQHASVPTVNYLLWPETFRLLKKHRSKSKKLALTNENGQPLKTEAIVNGKNKKIDNIRSAYNRVSNKLGLKYALKLLRKTASSKLGQSKSHGKYAQHFLGHAPTNVADKHYITPSQTQFDAAVKWLGEQFLTADLEKVKK